MNRYEEEGHITKKSDGYLFVGKHAEYSEEKKDWVYKPIDSVVVSELKRYRENGMCSLIPFRVLTALIDLGYMS